jgi:CPA2 family monovalent cation:H+ antiporter-2
VLAPTHWSVRYARMEHHGLILTLVAAIVLAFVFGFIAMRFRFSPIVGYLMAA